MTLEAKVFSSVLPMALVLLGLMCFVLTDKYVRKYQKSVMLTTLALTAAMIITDFTDYYMINVRPIYMIRLLTCTFGYIIRPVLVMLFHFFVGGNRKYIPAWCLVGVNTLIYVINLFTPIAFRIAIDAVGNTVFKRTALGYTCHIISAVLFLNLICLTFRAYWYRKKHTIVPVACVVVLAGAAALGSLIDQDMMPPVTFLTIATVICCVFIYIWFHMQIVEKYEEDLLAQQRIKIMVSQIQPHFLYNTIVTFKALCRTEPEKAAQVAEDFGLYLRQNLDSLNNTELIPVEKELEHTQVYAEIEMVRFENVRVEYDIQDNDFSLPALTIQPIVENAIRHGVRIREEGIVRVSTRQSDGYHEIVISDNGIGFNASKAYSGDESHIGIKNISPDTAVIFLTGYSKYAVDAFAVRASGYLLKPVSKEALVKDIAYVSSTKGKVSVAEGAKKQVSIKTFGLFDVYAGGQQVKFHLAKCKEILAYLVDRQGSSVKRSQLASILWEDRLYDRKLQKQLDVYIRSLIATLKEYKIERIFEMRGVL